MHVDFTVAQQVAAGLREGDSVDISAAGQSSPIVAKIVALDARIDPTTRNAMVRARIEGAANAPSPGASVRVRVPIGLPARPSLSPSSAMRKGPGGDQVFVIEPDKNRRPGRMCGQVESGAMLGDEVVIHAGLSAGERVAVSGSFKLREAVLVAIAGSPEEEGGSGQVIVGER